MKAAALEEPHVIQRIFAIAVIFIGTSIAWMVLGGTITSRTNDSAHQLTGKVASTWGTEQEQRPPYANLEWSEKRESTITTDDGKTRKKMVDQSFTRALPLDADRKSVV